jgi:hypothetical protein
MNKSYLSLTNKTNSFEFEENTSTPNFQNIDKILIETNPIILESFEIEKKLRTAQIELVIEKMKNNKLNENLKESKFYFNLI